MDGAARDAATSELERSLAVAGVGAAIFLALHGVFELAWRGGLLEAALERAWFMASRESLVITQITLGAAGLAVALLRPAGWRARLTDAGALCFGAMSAAIALFFVIGPEELMVGPVHRWPLALASAFFLLAPAVVAGTLLGGFLRDTLLKRPASPGGGAARRREK